MIFETQMLDSRETPATPADMITAAQLRAARAVLEWSREELGKAAGVSASTVKNYEAGKNTIPLVATSIERTLTEAGIEFSHDGDSIKWKRGRSDARRLPGDE
jgi:transcriptional regulator with XRE-family HTH domain